MEPTRRRMEELVGRLAEVIIGLLCIGLAIVVLANPLLSVATLELFLAAALGLDATLAVITGGLHARWLGHLEFGWRTLGAWIRRLGALGLGLIAVAVVAVVLLDPRIGTTALLYLIASGVAVLGLLRMLRGLAPGAERWVRVATTVTGSFTVLVLVLAAFVPNLGLATLAIVIAIALLFQGLQSVVSGLHPTDPRQVVLLKLVLFSLFYGLVLINWIDLFGKQVPGYGVWLILTYFAPFWVLLTVEGFSEWPLALSLGLLVSLANDVGYFFVGNLLFGFHENLGPWILGQLGFEGTRLVTVFEGGSFSIPVDSWLMGVSIYARAILVAAGLYYWWSHPSRLVARIEPPAGGTSAPAAPVLGAARAPSAAPAAPHPEPSPVAQRSLPGARLARTTVRRRPGATWGAIAVGLLLVVAAFAVLAVGPSSAGRTPPPQEAGSAPDAAPLVGPSAAAAPHAGVSPSYATPQAASILRALAARGVPATDVHLPNFAAAAEHRTGQVAPTYPSAPAPMGVADLGLYNVSGTSTVPYALLTPSAKGTIEFTNALSAYVDGDGPDMFGVQLNSVDVNVTVFGNDSNQFWTQNFVSYTPSSGELAFGDNVWNFSNPSGYLSPNVFYAYGPNGSLYAPIFYYAIGPTFTIHYPFSITFYNNATVLDDRPAVFFNYTLSNATMSVSGSYDYVIFNSSVGTPTGPTPALGFEVDGYGYDPIGLPNDIELDVVGNDDGDTTTFYAMQAALEIEFWNDSAAGYQPLPSAVDAGAETGETSDGVAVWYESGLSVAQMGLGPSFLRGLWNASSDPGVGEIAYSPVPNNSFTFVTLNLSGGINETTAQWVPTFGAATSNIYVPNEGTYAFDVLLSDYDPSGFSLTAHGSFSLSQSVDLTANPDEGVYTPLLAFGNAELPAISSSGTGTPTDPYLLENNQLGPLPPVFAAWNDFQFPVFPGLLLIGTTANVTVIPPSFSIQYPSWQPETFYSTGLPYSNNLQLELWNVSGVTLTDGTISGWLSFELSAYPLADLILWNSTYNLVASNTFLDQGDAIALYGGNNNTIWGNSFVATATSASNASEVLNQGPGTEGINESESGDLLYNNYFDVPVPALTPTLDPLSCQIECEPAAYLDTWNLARQPASDSLTVLGTNLSGSILGTSYEGGNYWSVYGDAQNPYGVLPFNDSGLIANGGDYVPLVPYSLYAVTATVNGLPNGVGWGFELDGIFTNGTTPSLVAYLPNGSYPLTVVVPTDFEVTGAPADVNVSGTAAQFAIDVAELGDLAGSVTPTVALVEVNGAVVPVGAAGDFSVLLLPGSYPVVVSAPGYQTYYTNTSITAGSVTTLPIALSASSPSSSAPSNNGIGTTGWVLIGALAAIALVFLGTTLVFARRARRPPVPPVAAFQPPPPPAA